MKKDPLYDRRKEVNIPRLTVIILMIIVGAVLGSIIGVEVEGNEDWFWDYINNSPQQFFRRNTIVNLIILVIVFVGGFTSAGLPFAMVGTISKGIIASVPITACVKLYGISGYFIAAEKGMINNLISAIAITIISMQSIEMSSLKRNGKKDKDSDKLYSICFCVCAAAIIFGAAIDGFLV